MNTDTILQAERTAHCLLKYQHAIWRIIEAAERHMPVTVAYIPHGSTDTHVERWFHAQMKGEQ